MGMRVKEFELGTLLDGKTQAYVPTCFHPILQENGDRSYLKPLDDVLHPYKTAVGKSYDVGVEVSRCPKGLKAYARVYHPMRDVMTLDEFEEWTFPEMDQEELDDIAARAKRYYESTDKALCGVFNGNVFELGQLYWGYENFYCNMMDEDTRDMMDRYFEKRVDLLMKDLEKYLAACGKYIECIEFTEDLGTQTSLLIPPGMYRERIKPHHKRMFDFIHKNYPEVKVLFHSCGAVYELIEDFIEIGVDALNPVQISAAGMEPERLVKAYGKDITFWGGGVDTQSTLCRKTPEEVDGGSPAQSGRFHRRRRLHILPGAQSGSVRLRRKPACRISDRKGIPGLIRPETVTEQAAGCAFTRHFAGRTAPPRYGSPLFPGGCAACSRLFPKTPAARQKSVSGKANPPVS